MKLLANELSMGMKFLLLGLLFLVTTPLLQAETFMQSRPVWPAFEGWRSEEHTSELQSRRNLVCRLLLEKKK